jgi:hypothetical protein
MASAWLIGELAERCADERTSAADKTAAIMR